MHHDNPDQLRPRRTHRSNCVWHLEGANEDHDLWAENTDEGVISTFVPTDEQRKRIMEGENIELRIWGPQPPVALLLTKVPIGAPPKDEE